MAEKYKQAGIVLLDKPSGVSSAKAVAIVKKKLNCAKIGHSGTLDPMATGLLVCVLNGATKLAERACSGTKIYSGSILFGTTTDSDDITGEVIAHTESIPSYDDIFLACKDFHGELMQVPPQISAVKKDGVRSYKRARRGELVDIDARPITIYDFICIQGTQPNTINFRIKCSKGTYIRSIARDLGEKLGCGACLVSLRREASEPFDLTHSVTIENLTQDSVMPWWKLLPQAAMLSLPQETALALRNGNENALHSIEGLLSGDQPVIYGSDGEWYGVLTKNESGAWHFAVNLA